MKKPNNSLVSIIMPSYNSAQTIEASINSVIEQSYNNWELLITDDNSNDDTLEKIRNYQSADSRIKVFPKSVNMGAGHARNNSIEHAHGRYIAFLDSDDTWYPEKLMKQITYMQENNLTLCYSAYDKVHGSQFKGCFIPPVTTNYKELLKTCVIGCLTAVYDTSLCGKRFMPNIRKRQDFALWLNILKDGHKAGGLSEPLACYRLDGGISQKKWRVLSYQWQIYRRVEKLSVPESIFYFSHYAINGLRKHA